MKISLQEQGSHSPADGHVSGRQPSIAVSLRGLLMMKKTTSSKITTPSPQLRAESPSTSPQLRITMKGSYISGASCGVGLYSTLASPFVQSCSFPLPSTGVGPKSSPKQVSLHTNLSQPAFQEPQPTLSVPTSVTWKED